MVVLYTSLHNFDGAASSLIFGGRGGGAIKCLFTFLRCDYICLGSKVSRMLMYIMFQNIIRVH